MSVSPQSRYNQGGTAVRIVDSAGTYNISVLRTVPALNVPFTLYSWKGGDRPDSVAAKLLGNATLWWAIFDINPEQIDPLRVPVGTVLRIPTGPIMGQGTLQQ